MLVHKIVLGLLLMTLSFGCSKKNVAFNETLQGDFYLGSGDIYFQKVYKQSFSFSGGDQIITLKNTPTGGLQVKANDGKTIKGIIVNYPLNWSSTAKDKIKIPEQMKHPVNASFQIEKDVTGYKVTVQHIWFSVDPSNKNQNNITLNNFLVQDNGLSFKRDKNTLGLVSKLNSLFTNLFLFRGGNVEDRF